MRFLRNTIFIFLFTFVGSANLLAQELSLVFEDYSGSMGDIVCVDLKVENFNNVSSMGWRTRFNPSIIRFINLDLTNSDLNGGVGGDLLSTGDFNISLADDGYIIIIWANGPPEGVVLNDGEILYTLCFEIIGEPCESSILATTEHQNEIEITVTDPLTGYDITVPESEINLVTGSVTVDPDGLFISESHCSSDDGSNTGSITFAPAGGNGPYMWTLTGPNSVNENGMGLQGCETATVSDLGPGVYQLVITDSNNVVRTENVTISASTDFPFVLTLDGINPTCFDDDDGSVFIDNIVGGEGAFTYEWSNQNFVDDIIEDLETGNYALTITDENGCSTSSSFTLQTDTVKLDVVVVSDPSCDGSSDGIVSFTATGGVPHANGGYDYRLDSSNPFYFINGTEVIGPFSPSTLPEGCGTAFATDGSGCRSDVVEYCLEAGSFSTLAIDSMNVSCFGECDGSVFITAGTIGTYSFQVTDEFGASVLGSNDANTFQASGLCPGLFMATITDNSDGCFIDTMFNIAEPLLLEMTIDSTGPGCGGGEGMVTLGAIGGTMPYSFLWEDSFDQPIRTNMMGGPYSVTVTDVNGCRDSIMWTFADGGTIGLSAGVLSAVSCASSADGSVTASVTSAGTFTFSWEDDNGLSLGDGPTINNLSGGIYHVTATDGVCTGVDMVILAPGQTPAADVTMTPPTCNNSDDGMLSVTGLIEGVAPAMYEWNIPPSTAIVSNGPVLLGGVGVYNLHIIDMNGCESDELFEILPSPDSISVTISNITENLCFGACSAGATFTASGGPAQTGDYTFIISDNPYPATLGTVTVTDLCAGTNYVLAFDGTCESDTIFFEVGDADEIMIDPISSIINPPGCDGGSDGSISAVVIGGNDSNYDLLWINEGIAGTDLSNLSEGEYILQITDGNGCIVNDTINLMTADPLMVEINTLITQGITCSSSSNGVIALNTFGGNDGTLIYEWSPDVSNGAIAGNLSSGFYTVTVSDVNGCSDSISYALTSAPPIVGIIPTPLEPDCFGETTTMCIDTVFGGVGNNYTYEIQNGPSLPIDSCFTLFAGEYDIKIFDGTGAECAFDTTIVIGQPSQVTVEVGDDVMIDLGSSTDPISAFIVSELDIDSIVWSPDIDIECNTTDCQIVTFSPNETTTYTITVIDENGCLATDDIQVLVDLRRNVYTPNIFSPNSNNTNDHFQLVTGNGVVMVNYLKIYDRWGNKIYVDESYMPNDTEHIGWDGTRNGTENEPGVYVFFAEVEFVDGVTIVYKGDVTLVR